jgi:hypothetical protein
MAKNFLGALPYFGIGAPQFPYGGGGGFGGNPYGNPMAAAAYGRLNRMAGFVRPSMMGAPAMDAAQLPMSFPAFSFALATGTNTITQQANPQTPFRGQRLSTIVVRSGTSAATTAPLLSQLLVGQKPIVLTSPGIALEVFNQSAFDTNLLMPPTYPGTVYTMNVNLVTALTTTDTLLALVGIIGSGIL